MTMPDPIELIESGERAERLGALDRALDCYTAAVDASTEPLMLARGLTRQADVHRARAEWECAFAAARRAQEVARGAHLPDELIAALTAEANVLMCQGDFGEATLLFRRVLATTNRPRARGIALQNVGSMLAQQGQMQAADDAFAGSQESFERAGYERGVAISLNNRGRLALDHGRLQRAEQLLGEAVAAAARVGDTELEAIALANYAESVLGGNPRRALELASTALGYFAACGNRWRQVECLRLLGRVHEVREDAIDAFRCYERGLQIAEEIGAASEIAVLRECVARHALSLGVAAPYTA
jgi:tetratricopeptide (TPR) repeat protein